MEYRRLDCPSCSAPLTVRENLDYITCSFCGTPLAVELSGSDLTLNFAKDIEDGVKNIGEKMEASLRDSSNTTQLELKRLQAQQQLSSLENRIVRLNDEIRHLESRKANRKQRKQLASLKSDRDLIKQRIESIEVELYGSTGGERKSQLTGIQQDEKSKLKAGCLSGCLTFFLVGSIPIIIAMWLDNILFGIPMGGEEPGLFGMIAAFIALSAGIIGFIYKYKPESTLSQWVKEKVNSIFKKNSNK